MRIIAHLDLDAFFASVEERDNPRWKGMPIVVGADPKEGRGRGVVSTANYKARQYGIGSAMPISRAWKLSEEAKKRGKPPAIFLPVNGERYSEVSQIVMDLISQYSKKIEQASIDEAYFDLSHLGSYASARKICAELQEKISEQERITASIGIGPNKLIAKIASGLEKPKGLTVVEEDKAEAFLEPMNVRALPGIGPKSEAVLNRKGMEKVADLKKSSEPELIEMFGKWGSELYQKARGISDSPLVTQWTAKSIGEQETFNEDTLDSGAIVAKLDDLCRQVFSRFKREFKTYRTIVVTARFSNFTTKTRSRTLPKEADDFKTLQLEALKVLIPFFDKRENPKRYKIRLIGIRIEKLK